jgi:hypothetical protein
VDRVGGYSCFFLRGLHVVELVLSINSTLALLGSHDTSELEVHFIRSVLDSYDGVSSALDVIQLAGEDGGEETSHILLTIEVELPLAIHSLRHIKEE